MHVQFMEQVTKFFEALKVLQRESSYSERFLNPGRTSTRIREYLTRMNSTRVEVEKWTAEKLSASLNRVIETTKELSLLAYFEPVRMIQEEFESLAILEPFGLDLTLFRDFLNKVEETRFDVWNWSTPRFNFEVRAAKELLSEVKKLERKFLTSEWLRVEIEREIDIIDDFELEASLLKKHRAFHQLMTKEQFLSLMSEIDGAREVAAANRIAEVTTPKPAPRRVKSQSAKSLADQELRLRMKGKKLSDDTKGHGQKKRNAK